MYRANCRCLRLPLIYSVCKFALFGLQYSSVLTKNLFLELLAENGRLKSLPNIANLFKQVMSAHRGDLLVEVTTAKVNNRTCKFISNQLRIVMFLFVFFFF